jgi:hypothetical protein
LTPDLGFVARQTDDDGHVRLDVSVKIVVGKSERASLAR